MQVLPKPQLVIKVWGLEGICGWSLIYPSQDRMVPWSQFWHKSSVQKTIRSTVWVRTLQTTCPTLQTVMVMTLRSRSLGAWWTRETRGMEKIHKKTGMLSSGIQFMRRSPRQNLWKRWSSTKCYVLRREVGSLISKGDSLPQNPGATCWEEKEFLWWFSFIKIINLLVKQQNEYFYIIFKTHLLYY